MIMTCRYHSHAKAQYMDGLKGALIVYDPAIQAKESYIESVLSISDWYQEPAARILAATNKGMMAMKGLGLSTIPGGGIINDKGQFNCSESKGEECKYSWVTAKHGTSSSPGTKV
jgi:iron transport multicopper oxidase